MLAKAHSLKDYYSAFPSSRPSAREISCAVMLSKGLLSVCDSASSLYALRTPALTVLRPGIKVESTIKAGGLVPDDMILRLIRNELNQRGWLSYPGGKPNLMTLCSASTAAVETTRNDDSDVSTFLSSGSSLSSFAHSQLAADPSASFLLDGFPRTASQASSLDSIVPINLAVAIHTPLDVIIERISGRWVHEPSGRVYNTGYNAPRSPGRDDVTGEPLVRRSDDDEETYRQRHKNFIDTSTPLLDHYANKGVLWEVDGLSSDEITPKLFAEFERRFC